MEEFMVMLAKSFAPVTCALIVELLVLREALFFLDNGFVGGELESNFMLAIRLVLDKKIFLGVNCHLVRI